METVRIYEIPDCKMVSSGIGMFGEEKFTNFNKWITSPNTKTLRIRRRTFSTFLSKNYQKRTPKTPCLRESLQ